MLASKSKTELLRLTRALVPPLLPTFYKGQLGKVLIFGGQYNGAVYFAADASAKVGADLVHVVCSKDVAAAIRGYSPDLMIHPYMIEEAENEDKVIEEQVLPKVKELLDRVDVVAMGSGLGRSSMNLKTATRVIEEIKKRKLPLVLDADALYLLAQDPTIIEGYSKAILTPNIMEFKRLYDKLKPGEFSPSKEPTGSANDAIKLSKLLGGVTVVQKGEKDIIAQGDEYVINDSDGGNRRCGGQGDTLSGSIATFLAWGHKYQQNLWDHDDSVDSKWVPLLVAYGASMVVRKASLLAFKEKKRSMQATDLHSKVSEAFESLFPTKINL